MRVHYKTFGCKANQYDTEQVRQTLETHGGAAGPTELDSADLCVVNTCTVTNRADADARRFVRRAARRNPDAKIVVTGCSAALQGATYRSMDEVSAVVEGHDPGKVLAATAVARRGAFPGPAPHRPPLWQLGTRRSLDRTHWESVGAGVLRRRAGATRGWLKVQDGCDRRCAFCATRLARGRSVSRDPLKVVREARALAQNHPELVITGVHIGHYGRDLHPKTTLTALVRRLLAEVPGPRFRLGSIEATEIDDGMVRLLAESGGQLAPHLHMPLQSGADPVLRKMRRWHTREDYRRRAFQIADAIAPLGLGADVIAGFPGESASDHASTLALVEELPFTYLHVFPYSRRDGTAAAELPAKVPERVAKERARELRDLGDRKRRRYARKRGGGEAEVVLEGSGGTALTGDYLRVTVQRSGPIAPSVLHQGRLSADGSSVRVGKTPPRDRPESEVAAPAPL